MKYRITLLLLLGSFFMTNSSLIALPTSHSKTEVDHKFKKKEKSKQDRWIYQLKENIVDKFSSFKDENDSEIARKVRILSITSFVLGLASFVLLGPLGSIPAVILGFIAVSKSKKISQKSDGEKPESLKGLAIAGIILGIINILLFAAVIAIILALAV